MFALSAIPWRLIGYIALMAGVAIALHTVDGWRKDAAKLPEVQQQYSEYQTQVAEDRKKADELNKADEAARTQLATTVTSIDSKLDLLAKRPIQTVNHYETTLPNGTVCPADRLSDEWAGVYNDLGEAATIAP